MRRYALAVALAACAACQEGKQPPTAARPTLADSADQTMFGAKAIVTDRGLMRAELLADTAFWFDDNTRAELRGVRTTFFAQNGARNAVLTSREGTYNTRAGGMEARRDVLVVTEDGRRLTTSQLRYDQRRDEISSDSAFVLTEPGRRLEGVGFTSDPNMNNVHVLKMTGGTSGRVTIPNQ